MLQAVPMNVLGGRLPAPPPSRRVRPSIPYPSVRIGVSGLSVGMAAPPPSGDWASRSRHQYGWPVPYAPPARPEQIQRRSPWLYGGPYSYGTYGMHGLGDATDAAVAQKVGAVAGTVVPVIPGVASSVASIVGVTAAAAIPIIGAAIAGITIGIAVLLNSGCGQTCIITSNWANQAEALIRQNLTAYFSLAKPRAQSAQAIALANFDAIWNKLVAECSSPQVGNAGVHCISDRQAGACVWKQTATYSADIMAAGEPQIGQCWNWFSGYRDPIANDPNVVPDSQSAQYQAQSQQVSQATAIPGPTGTVSANTTTSGVFDSKTLLLLGGLALAVYAMGGNS